MQLFLFLFPLQHTKRPPLQNKQVVVLRMAFRARKVLGTFEKRAPGRVPRSEMMSIKTKTVQEEYHFEIPCQVSDIANLTVIMGHFWKPFQLDLA